jgi:hypothetical protein
VPKCDRAGRKPATNRQCAAGTCQHTCESGTPPKAARSSAPKAAYLISHRVITDHVEHSGREVSSQFGALRRHEHY